MSSRFPIAQVPDGLRTAEFVLRPIVADDAEKDHAAVMETREDLRLWEQSTWPEEDFTVEANRADLVGLEERHSDGRAFTYTVLTPDGDECLGCVYIFPTTAPFLARSAVSPVGGARWDEVEAVVYFWARRTQMVRGMDSRLLDSLRVWFAGEWALEQVVFVTNEQFAHQVDVIRRSGLRLEFELVEPGKAGKYLVFGSPVGRTVRRS
jgi:hypothetical protein